MERLEYDLLFRWFVGHRRRRCGLGPFGLLEEPRPAAGRRHRGEVPGGGAGAAAGEEASVDRALLGRRHADRGLGVDEELQAEGRLGRAAGGGRRTQRRGGLPRPEAVERDACLDHRSGCPALPQGTGQGGQALLHRPRPDGEPPRPAGRRLPDAGRRACRAGGGAAHDRASRRPAAGDHARRRQGLRRGRLRQRAALDEGDAARRAEHQRPTARRSTGARRGTAAMPSASASASASRRRSAGSRRSPGRRRRSSAAVDRVGWAFTFAAAAYNLVRLPKLLAEAG